MIHFTKVNQDEVKKRYSCGLLSNLQDGCDRGGPNGAFKPEDGWLSWCKDGK
jgi:hypothetical protein